LGNIGIRAEVITAIPNDVTGNVDPGIALVFNTDITVRLVVFEQDIITRLVGLDQGIFEQQGISLRLDNGKLDPIGVAHHNTGAVEAVFTGTKVTSHPVAQHLCLTNIEDRIVWSDKAVDTRLFGYGVGDGLKV